MCYNNFDNIVFERLFKYFDHDIDRDKINIVKNEDYDEESRISIYQTPFNSIIFTCTSFYENMVEKIKIDDFNKKISMDQLKNTFDNQSFTDEQNTHCLFLNPESHEIVSSPKDCIIKEIDKRFKDKFNELKKECSKDDLEEAQVSIDDDYVVGCFYDNKLIAAASYWYWGEGLADIGVITHPNFRKKGLAKSTISYLALQGIELDRINIFRHAADNKASKRLALAMKFQEKMIIETTKLI
ncbi:MAG: GNAT family N-acetyltransferase [Bacillota bacterium]